MSLIADAHRSMYVNVDFLYFFVSMVGWAKLFSHGRVMGAGLERFSDGSMRRAQENYAPCLSCQVHCQAAFDRIIALGSS